MPVGLTQVSRRASRYRLCHDAPAHRPARALFLSHGVSDPAVALHKAVIAIGNRVRHQAYTMAFGDIFLLLGVVLVVAILAAILLKKPVPSVR